MGGSAFFLQQRCIFVNGAVLKLKSLRLNNDGKAAHGELNDERTASQH